MKKRRSAEKYLPGFAYCYRIFLIIVHYRAEMEIGSIQDDGKIKDQNDTQRQGLMPMLYDWHFF
jgi:hypothetical protein